MKPEPLGCFVVPSTRYLIGNNNIEEEDDGLSLQSSVPPADRAAWQPDFHWVMDHLAVGACFPIDKAGELAGAHCIRAVVDLRSEDRDGERALAAAGIAFLHLPTPDLEAASAPTLDQGVAFVRDYLERHESVLIHCQHGIGRSALLGLCVMVDRGFQPLDALVQAKERRMRISPSEAQYRGWADWLLAHGQPVPSYHEFGCVAYRHLSGG